MREIKLRVKILRPARGALPDCAGQSIILKDRGRRFPAGTLDQPVQRRSRRIHRSPVHTGVDFEL